jgi:hypothetical protein
MVVAYAQLHDALQNIFAITGSFKSVVRACCHAQRMLASRNRDLVRAQGWIVGKVDNPHQ